MNKSIILMYTIFVVTLPTVSFTQEWIARYNGPGNGYDEAWAIAIDDHGNIYVTGYSAGPGTDYDYATVKYDSLGVEQWAARYDGPVNGSDSAYAIAVDVFGNVYVTGRSIGLDTTDYATVKYDSSGVEKWVARYNGPDNGYDEAWAIAVDNSGNVYVTGESRGIGTHYDYATVKYDSSGVEQWVARYNGSDNHWDEAKSIAIDNSGNVYVTGSSEGIGTWFDYVTVKYDSSGVEQWVARYSGLGGGEGDHPSAITIDIAGNVYVTGTSTGAGTNYDYATVKYDSSGMERWVARYNGTGNHWDYARAIAVDNAGNVYITGNSRDSSAHYDYVTVKYDSSGVEQWVARYNGPGNFYDYAKDISVDDSGNVYITGGSIGSSTYYDYATIKYDSLGIEKWVARYDGPDNFYDYARAIVVDDLGNIYVTGGSDGSGTQYDYATIKYSYTHGVEDEKIVIKKNKIAATIISGSLLLPTGKKCKVFDITGRVMMPDKIKPGIYFIEVEGVITQKVVKIR